MTPQVFAFLTVLVSGLFSVLVAWVTHKMATGRDVDTLVRSEQKLRREAMRQLFEDGLALLYERTALGGHKPVDVHADVNAISNYRARLELAGIQAVTDQFDRVCTVLERFAQQHANSLPRMGGGVVTFTPMVQREAKETADMLLPCLQDELGNLSSLMKAHLSSIEG